MFARVMSTVMAVILLLTAVLTVTGAVSARNQQINTRLNTLISEAEDIAYLAAQTETSSWFFGGYTLPRTSQNTGRYLNRKATQVYDEFGAYIAIVDRQGNIQDNMRTAYGEDPDFVMSLSGTEIMEALVRILRGEKMSVRSDVDGDPVFTVGVPYTKDGLVQGAVFIQTRAQRIESGLSEMLLRSSLIALVALLLAGICVFWVVRSVMKPLSALAAATAHMSDGDFSVRVDETRGSREVRHLAATFNTMAQKLDAVENSRKEFVANVSHELKSPITSIRGFVEGMAEGVIPPEDHPKYLQLVSDETRRLSGLIGELLALSRLEQDDAKLNYTDFDINEMLRRAIIRRINDLDAQELDVDCDFGTDPCPVHADADRIEQVVVNLFDNAIRFTPKGGRIVLETRTGDKACTVTVRDNGVGIAEEDRPRVFERFFTVDRAHTAGKGTGLGLSICQRILQMHGHQIRLLDTEEGAAFSFTLDRAEQKPGALYGQQDTDATTQPEP